MKFQTFVQTGKECRFAAKSSSSRAESRGGLVRHAKRSMAKTEMKPAEERYILILKVVQEKGDCQ